MKLAIASGKGGVGKSMLSSALAMLFSEEKQGPEKVTAVDCDVDAPNLAVWLNETGGPDRSVAISTSSKPVIDFNKCDGCGLCRDKCRFNAIDMKEGRPQLNKFLCEGCGACSVVCPRQAIAMKPVENGQLSIKKTKYGFYLVSGYLLPGETGSGKVVSQIKQKADELKAVWQIIDSSPGTGCPVIASLQDADFVILITEPTPSGLADLDRVLPVVKHFKLPWRLVINKWDINPSITHMAEKQFRGKLLGRISYDKGIFQAISRLTPVLETKLKAKEEVTQIYQNLRNVISA